MTLDSVGVAACATGAARDASISLGMTRVGDSEYALAVHRRQELRVTLRFAELVEQEFHALDGRERIQDAAEDEDAVELFARDE